MIHPKVEGFQGTTCHESLSQYLSNEYQCYGVSIEFRITNNFLHSYFGDKSIPP
jgi:hypothetical protein